MSGAQRTALAELVHEPGERQPSRSIGQRSRLDFVWPAVLALALVLGGLALFEGFQSVQGVDTLHTSSRTQPQVDVTITRLAPVIESAQAAAPGHSSTAVNRTM